MIIYALYKLEEDAHEVGKLYLGFFKTTNGIKKYLYDIHYDKKIWDYNLGEYLYADNEILLNTKEKCIEVLSNYHPVFPGDLSLIPQKEYLEKYYYEELNTDNLL